MHLAVFFLASLLCTIHSPTRLTKHFGDEACRRADAIREFLKSRSGSTTAADVAGLAGELGLSQATANRLIKLFRAGGTVMSLVDRKRGRPEGFRVLDEEREEIIRTTIKASYLNPNRPTVSQLVRDVQTNCMSTGHKPPHRRTIIARLKDIDLQKRARRRGESKIVKATTAVPGVFGASRPLEVVIAYHTGILCDADAPKDWNWDVNAPVAHVTFTPTASPYRNVFGGNLRPSRAERTEPFRKLNLFGIGSETSNKVDNMLVYGADDPALVETYRTLVQSDQVYGETPAYKRAQQSYLEGDDPSAVVRFLGLLRGQRQRLFFTISDELADTLDLWDLTVFRYAGLYLETSRALAEKRALPRQVMPMLLRGLNRVFTGMLIQNQDELVLASSGSQSQSRTSPLLEEFVSVARRGGEEVALLGDGAGGMKLVVRLARDDPPAVTLQLSTTRFEFLGRVAEGALSSDASVGQPRSGKRTPSS